MVLLGSVPDPEDEAALELTNLDSVSLVSRSLISWRLINLGSMKLALIEIRLVEITTSVLIEIIPPIEIVLIILMGRETGRLNLICNHLSNALTISLSSATSDEMAGVEELVLTLATTTLAHD
nr:hypothetical protein [Tanacetum cinerariifolium]